MTWDLYLFLKCAGIAVFVFVGGALVSRAFRISRSKAYLIQSFAVFAALAGSRLWFIIQHYFGKEAYDPSSFWNAWDNSGSVLYGWVLGGTFALVLLTRYFKLNTIRYLDIVLPLLLVCQFLNRMGCFDAGCCYGKPSAFPFPLSVYSDIGAARVYPVQLYEAIYDLLLFWYILKRPKQTGLPTFLYFVGYPAGRFFFEFLRGDNQPAAMGLTVPQITSLILIAWAFLKLRPSVRSQTAPKTAKK